MCLRPRSPHSPRCCDMRASSTSTRYWVGMEKIWPVVRVEHHRAFGCFRKLAHSIFAWKARNHLVEKPSRQHDDQHRRSGQCRERRSDIWKRGRERYRANGRVAPLPCRERGRLSSPGRSRIGHFRGIVSHTEVREQWTYQRCLTVALPSARYLSVFRYSFFLVRSSFNSASTSRCAKTASGCSCSTVS